MSCNRRAAPSVAVMLHVSYAIAFQFNSHLGDFLFVFFGFFFKTFKTECFAVRFCLSVRGRIRVTIRVSYRLSGMVRVSVRLGLQLG